MVDTTIYRKRKIALLDRDGTIIQKIHHLFHPGDVHIIAYDLLRYLQEHGYALIVITNQSVIGRGIARICWAREVNRTVAKKYREQEIYIDAVFMCPHVPEDHCNCRKPRPGLLHAVDETMTMDLYRSVLIGDSESDVAAGRAYGIDTNILIPTDRPWHAMEKLEVHEASLDE